MKGKYGLKMKLRTAKAFVKTVEKLKEGPQNTNQSPIRPFYKIQGVFTVVFRGKCILNVGGI